MTGELSGVGVAEGLRDVRAAAVLASVAGPLLDGCCALTCVGWTWTPTFLVAISVGLITLVAVTLLAPE